MVYRVLWRVEQKVFATEYATRREAESNRDDIDGWCPGAWIEEIPAKTKPRKGPFEVSLGCASVD